jgi:hypothetical protein
MNEQKAPQVLRTKKESPYKHLSDCESWVQLIARMRQARIWFTAAATA